jgi:16S rRNA (guanine527-N7)-methyltransferase
VRPCPAGGPPDWRGRLLAAGVEACLIDALARFLELLGRFRDALDLVGRLGEDELVRDHVLESLCGAPLLPQAGRLLDIGSGGGFPAIPLLLAVPGLKGTLLEPRERRWAFLREVVRELGLDAEVWRTSVGEAAGRFEALTVRALPRRIWSGEVERLAATGGVVVWWTRESAPPAAGWQRVITSALPNGGRGTVSTWRRRST